MLLEYKNKTINMVECKTFFSRLKGFMFVKDIDKALLFNRFNSIHSFFMKSNIDVIMCDRSGKILYYFNDLKKNKIIFPKHGVYKIIELPVDYFRIKIGDYIKEIME